MIDRLPLTLETLKNTKLGRVIVKLKDTSPNAGEQRSFVTEISGACLAQFLKTLSDGAYGLRWCVPLEELLPFAAYTMLQTKNLAIIFYLLTLLWSYHVSNCRARLLVSLHVVAVKDMASNLENRWRSLFASTEGKTPSESGSKKSEGKSAEGGSRHFARTVIYIANACTVGLAEHKPKKRKMEEPPPSKVIPPTKKIAVSKPSSSKPVVLIKKELPKQVTSVKDAKSDSSFFSAPKPKPKLPSFKKAPPLRKETVPDQNIAQPSAVDPFKDALAAMTKARSSPTPADVTAPPPPVATGPTGKKKKKVSFATEDKLLQIKLIEPAVYDDEVTAVSILLMNSYLFMHMVHTGCLSHS